MPLRQPPIVAWLLVLMASAGCFESDQDGASPSPTPSSPMTTTTTQATTPTTPTTAEPPPLTDVSQLFRLTSPSSAEGSWAIRPATLTVDNNTRLRVTARNDDLATGPNHNWYIEGFAKATAFVTPGAQASVDVEIREAGSFKYWCQVGGHRQNGMEGTLTVAA